MLPLLAVAALGALGTGLAVPLQYGLGTEVGPTAAGVALLHEHLDWNTAVGAVIVLGGAVLTQGRRRKSRRRESAHQS